MFKYSDSLQMFLLFTVVVNAFTQNVPTLYDVHRVLFHAKMHLNVF